MADEITKTILPLLEGREGQLRMMRFWSKVDVRGPQECWDWQASLNKNGYGRFKVASYRMIMAHRFSLIAHKQEEPGDFLVLHSCDRPICCNPHHLRFGTVAENSADMMERGRHKTVSLKGASNPRAKLTDEQLALVVSRLHEGQNNATAAIGLPITPALIGKIRTGYVWAEQTAALGWEPRPMFIRRQAA